MSPRGVPVDDLPPLEDDIDDPGEMPEEPVRRIARRTRRRRAPNPALSEAGRKGVQLKAIGQELDQAFILLGTALSPFVPVTGAVLVARGPQGSDIVCNIARKDERVFRALLALSKYAVYGELVMFLGTIAVAVSVDIGAQRADSIIAQRLIGSEIMNAVHGQQSSNGANSEVPRPVVPQGWPAGSPSA